jgi:Mg2+-importing ATPase
MFRSSRRGVNPATQYFGSPAHAFWSGPLDRLLAALDTSTQGLSSEQATIRLTRHGSNVVVTQVGEGVMRGVLAQLTSPITLLLLAAAGLAIGVGDRVDGSIILGALFASLALGFWQERRAIGAVQRLLAMVRATATVVRDGEDVVVPFEEVVPGDVLRLTAGSRIPADARLVDAKDLHVDQAALTGEPFPVEKEAGDLPADAPLAERNNTVYFGTHVVSGNARAVVVSTGAKTAFGGVAQRLTLRPAETDFQRGVRRFGYLLLEVTLVLALAIFAINVALHRPVLEALLFTLALAVGLTPQLLPAIVSVTLSQGAQRMAAQQVLVRRLASIEDLGGMGILCTDKTGTITQGIVQVYAAEDWTRASNPRIALFAYLNAAFESGFANPIDTALRASKPPKAEDFIKVDEIPYDFERKRLSVVVRDRDGRQLLITKGAVQSVLDISEMAEDAGGRMTSMALARAAVEARLEDLSREGYRCLGVAYRELKGERPHTREDEHGLVFLGILSFADPLKPDAAGALHELADLGIRTVIVTGDNRHVAARVAAEAGLPSDSVMTGAELDRLSEAALVGAAPRVGVFAEMEPRQKERIIVALKKAGHAVGFLGEGINDATALYAADVGISVDSAADVARQAADIVLLEKDLGALARGVREGRRAFANTLKYVFITTSANFGNMFSMAGASLFVPFLPLLPKQILLTNVLTDLPAMSTAADQLDPELVAQPRRWDNRDIRRFMITFGVVSSFFDYMTFGALLLLRVPQTAFRTAWFLESVLSELFILLVIRTNRPFYRSRMGAPLLWTTVAVGIATLALPWTPLGPALGLGPISPLLLATIAVILILYVAVSEVGKRALSRAGARPIETSGL